MKNISHVISYILKNCEALETLSPEDMRGFVNQRAFLRICVNIGEACKYLKTIQPLATGDFYFEPTFRHVDLISRVFQSIRNMILHDYLYLQYCPDKKTAKNDSFRNMYELFQNNVSQLKKSLEELKNSKPQDKLCEYKAQPYQGASIKKLYFTGDYLFTAVCEILSFQKMVEKANLTSEESFQEFYENKLNILALETFFQNIGQCLKEYENSFKKEKKQFQEKDSYYNKYDVRKNFLYLKDIRNEFSHNTISDEIEARTFGNKITFDMVFKANTACHNLLTNYSDHMLAVCRNDNKISSPYKGKKPSYGQPAILFSWESKVQPKETVQSPEFGGLESSAAHISKLLSEGVSQSKKIVSSKSHKISDRARIKQKMLKRKQSKQRPGKSKFFPNSPKKLTLSKEKFHEFLKNKQVKGMENSLLEPGKITY